MQRRTRRMTTSIYTVKGMTCGHCVSSVEGEVGRLGGVSEVKVDLLTGRVSVTSESELDPATVRAAVEEAGYEVVS
jgi:copper ion binding protein